MSFDNLCLITKICESFLEGYDAISKAFNDLSYDDRVAMIEYGVIINHEFMNKKEMKVNESYYRLMFTDLINKYKYLISQDIIVMDDIDKLNINDSPSNNRDELPFTRRVENAISIIEQLYIISSDDLVNDELNNAYIFTHEELHDIISSK